MTWKYSLSLGLRYRRHVGKWGGEGYLVSTSDGIFSKLCAGLVLALTCPWKFLVENPGAERGRMSCR